MKIASLPIITKHKGGEHTKGRHNGTTNNSRDFHANFIVPKSVFEISRKCS